MNSIVEKYLSQIFGDDHKDSLIVRLIDKMFLALGFVKDLDRNNALREDILKRIAGSILTDDERASFWGLPEGCRMREGAKIISPENLVIGKYCWIGEGAILDASGGLEIGEQTSIGLNVMLWTHDSHKLNIRGENSPESSHKIKRLKTKIGSNCFIAGPSVIMPGVSIGNKCIVGPGSVVYEDLPDKTIYQPYREMVDSLEKIKLLEKEVANLKKSLHV